jgi:hypothetical protein
MRKYLREVNLKEVSFHSYLLLGLQKGSTAWRKPMAGESCSADGGQEAKRENLLL